MDARWAVGVVIQLGHKVLAMALVERKLGYHRGAKEGGEVQWRACVVGEVVAASQLM